MYKKICKKYQKLQNFFIFLGFWGFGDSIPCIFNVPYQPDYNPCESCLSKVKSYYKREKLKYLVKNESVDYEKLIK